MNEQTQAAKYFSALFRGYTDGWIEVRMFRGSEVKRYTYQLPFVLRGDEFRELANHCVDSSARGFDVYCGVLPRNKPLGPHPLGKESVERAQWVWIDLDNKVSGASLDALAEWDMVVSSGNGWHGYRTLPERVISTKKDKTEFESRMRSVQQMTIPGTDNVSDVSRILRVPGTLNWKDKANPKRVELIRGGGIAPSFERTSEWLPYFNDPRLDNLLDLARHGKLGILQPGLVHSSGRITQCLDDTILGMFQAIKYPLGGWHRQTALDDIPELLERLYGGNENGLV